MNILTKKTRTQSGLVLEDDGFRFLTLQRKPTGFTVLEAVHEKYPDGMNGRDAFFDSASGIEKYFAFAAENCGVKKKRQVNFALPMHEATIRMTNLPTGMSHTEALLAFRYDFGNYFPFSEKEGVFDVAEIKHPCEGGKRFIAVAVRRKLIENIEDAAVKCGIKLSVIEPMEIAAERSVAPETGTAPCAYVYVGVPRSLLVLSWQGNGIYYRNISLSNADVLAYGDGESEEFAQAAENFSDEIASSFNFGLAQNAEFETKDIRLFGIGASRHLCGFVAKELPECSVTLVSPLSVHGIETNGSGWETAVGLAMR